MPVLDEKEKLFRSEDLRMVPHVVCFSTSFDERMWRDYEAAGALEVMITEPLIRAFIRGKDPSREPVDQDNYVRLMKVRYDGPETRMKIRKLIMEAKAVGNIDRWCETVHAILMECRMGIKPVKFQHEKEYRLVYLMPDEPKENDPALRYVCETHFDLSGDKVIENAYDPENNGYVWVDVTNLIRGVILEGSDPYKKKLKELAGLGDRFFVCYCDELPPQEANNGI